MKCPRCHRLVVSDHECDGDARSTCSIYGCGRPIVAWYPTDVDGTGRTVRLGRCSVHHKKGSFTWTFASHEEMVAAMEAAAKLARYEEALRYYAARYRYHSECCGSGNCINNDGGDRARRVLSGG